MGFGYRRIYPNLYVILIADSALCRKSSALEIGTDLMMDMTNPPSLYTQKMTPQAFIADLSLAFRRCGTSASFICADELSAFLGGSQQSLDSIIVLTKLYDCPAHWGYKTRMHGEEPIENSYITFLATTTSSWMKVSLPPHVVGGGFTSRIIMIRRESPREPSYLPRLTADELTLRSRLLYDLEQMRGVKGEFKLSQDAERMYKDWYEEHFKNQYNVLKGYYGRKHTHILKIAMLLSFSKRDDLIIHVKDFILAKMMVEAEEAPTMKALEEIESTPEGLLTAKICDYIQKHKKIGRVELLRRFSYTTNAKQLTELIETLAQQDLIEVTQVVGVGKRMRTTYIAKENVDETEDAPAVSSVRDDEVLEMLMEGE